MDQSTIWTSRTWYTWTVLGGIHPSVVSPVDTPVLVVIDALDESGEVRSREQILHMLAGNADPFPTELTKLPANLRVLVTSHPLDDIQFSWACPLVCISANSFSCPLTHFHVHRLIFVPTDSFSCPPTCFMCAHLFLCLLTHSCASPLIFDPRTPPTLILTDRPHPFVPACTRFQLAEEVRGAQALEDYHGVVYKLFCILC